MANQASAAIPLRGQDLTIWQEGGVTGLVDRSATAVCCTRWQRKEGDKQGVADHEVSHALEHGVTKKPLFSGITIIQTECARQIVRGPDHLIPDPTFKLLAGKTLQGAAD
jgi:hypothetical protein